MRSSEDEEEDEVVYFCEPPLSQQYTYLKHLFSSQLMSLPYYSAWQQSMYVYADIFPRVAKWRLTAWRLTSVWLIDHFFTMIHDVQIMLLKYQIETAWICIFNVQSDEVFVFSLKCINFGARYQKYIESDFLMDWGYGRC